MDIGVWEPEMVYQNHEGLDVNTISDDGNMLALTKTLTTSQDQFFLYNIASGEMTEISDPENPANYGSSHFSKDGKKFFYLTNADKEFAYLVEDTLENGNSETLFETNRDVMYSYLSENEKYRVIAINENGKNSLTILDNATGKAIDFPQIPDGNVVAVNMSDGEKLMRLTVGTSQSPNNLYVYRFETKEMKKLGSTQYSVLSVQ